MNDASTQPRLSRRSFLRLTAAVGVSAVGGYALAEYAPWLDYAGQTAQTWQPARKAATISANMRELVRYATLAANGHNTQPWRFAIGEDSIEIHPHAARRLPVVDPHDRELWISLSLYAFILSMMSFDLAGRVAEYETSRQTMAEFW